MSMDINAVSGGYASYYGSAAKSTAKTTNAAPKEETGASLSLSSEGMKAYEEKMKSGDVVVKSAEAKEETASLTDKAKADSKENPFAVGKWNETDRAALVEALKADQEAQKNSLMNMVRDMLGQQAGLASGDESSIWKFLASGDYTVDAETKAKAQEAVSEDGYYGVKQTSERMFQFAQALAGDDVEKMKKMQDAIQKGYDKATEMWGKELPEISKNTMNAVNDLFSSYYESKGVEA